MKLNDIKLGTDWQVLTEFASTVNVGDTFLLYNASTDKQIFYTENAEAPTKDTFYKRIKPLEEVEIVVGEQSVYLRSDTGKAKLILSIPNETMALQAGD